MSYASQVTNTMASAVGARRRIAAVAIAIAMSSSLAHGAIVYTDHGNGTYTADTIADEIDASSGSKSGGQLLLIDFDAQTSYNLDDITFKNDDSATSFPGSNESVVYINVYADTGTGNGTDDELLGNGIVNLEYTFVGSSDNFLNLNGVAAGTISTWTFSGISLDEDAAYLFVPSTTNVAGDMYGLSLEQSRNTTTGGFLAKNSYQTGTAQDTYFVANFSVSVDSAESTPEPSTIMLIGCGLLGFGFVRRVRRRSP